MDTDTCTSTDSEYSELREYVLSSIAILVGGNGIGPNSDFSINIALFGGSHSHKILEVQFRCFR